MKSLLLLTCLAVLLGACGGDEKPDKAALLAELDSADSNNQALEVDTEKLNGVLQSIPSPLETAILIKEIGRGYHPEYLADPQKAASVNGSTKQALNLGIYGADLAYANIYQKSADGLSYLKAVNTLAENLSLEQFFEAERMRPLIRQSANLDSLLALTTENFNQINLYLQEQRRSHLSALLLIGGWIEGLHLSNQVYLANPNAELRERIGEQEIVLDQLLEVLSYYKGRAELAEVEEQLLALKATYGPVSIERTEGEVEMVEVDGIFIAQSTARTTVTITDSDVQNIAKATKKLRSWIVE